MINVNGIQIKNQLLPLQASEIASLIRSRQITSEACVSVFIDHIEAVNPQLNAVVETRFEDALAEAKAADDAIGSADFTEQPLYGVPISVKESLHVKGMQTTGGLVHRKDIMMTEDADVIKKLKAAGAIILCKTNTPALCFCHETDNKLYGKTNNAWNLQFSAGGSSGGEAALIGVGGAPIGIGTDIGGSIRIPSHFNGVVGFKPGKDQVSTAGHFPADTIPLKARMSSIGPIGKSVEDVRLVYHIIRQQQKKKTLYEKMVIDILPEDNGYPLSKETASILHDVHEYLGEFFQTTVSIPPYFNDTAGISQEIMSIDGAKELKSLAFNTDRPNVWKHYMNEKLTSKTATHLYLSWALIGAGLFKPSTKRVQEISRLLEDGDVVLDTYLKNRLLIFPVYYRGAQKHGEVYKEIFSLQKTYTTYMPYLTYANVWGLPSLTIPVGYDERQMPIGIQVIGKIGNEEAIFSIGELLEKQFGGYIRSKHYDEAW